MYIIAQVICWAYTFYCVHFCSAMCLTGLLEGWCPRISRYCNRDCLLCMYLNWVGDFRDTGNPYRNVNSGGENESTSERGPDFV